MEPPAKVANVFLVLLQLIRQRRPTANIPIKALGKGDVIDPILEQALNDRIVALKIEELWPGITGFKAENYLDLIFKHGLFRLLQELAAKQDYTMPAYNFTEAVRFGQYEMADWLSKNVTLEGDTAGETIIEPVYSVLDRGFEAGWLTMEMIRWLESRFDIAAALRLEGDAENRRPGPGFPYDYGEVLDGWLLYLERPGFDREVARWLVEYFGVANWYRTESIHDPQLTVFNFLIAEKFVDPASAEFFEDASNKATEIMWKILEDAVRSGKFKKAVLMVAVGAANGKWDTKAARMSPEKQILIKLAKKAGLFRVSE